MRIVLFVDSLAPGGAQRQLLELARLLLEKGEEVAVITYRLSADRNIENDFKGLGARLSVVEDANKLRRLIKLREAMLALEADVLIAFLNSPSMIAELLRLSGVGLPLIVSERSTQTLVYEQFLAIPRFLLHSVADFVVCNSLVQERSMIRIAPWLRSRARYIANCVDSRKFFPRQGGSDDRSDGVMRIIGLGRYEEIKNPRLIVMALGRVLDVRPDIRIELDWFGDNFFRNGKATPRSTYYFELSKDIERWGLSEKITLNGVVQVDASLYHRYSVLCLPSRKEGCPNAVCEAMTCGLPVIGSDVGDVPHLVVDGETGFLFEEGSEDGLCNALIRFADLDADRQKAMSQAGQKRAGILFGEQRFLAEFEDVIRRSIRRRAGRS